MLPVTGKTAILMLLADPVDHVVGNAMLNERFQEMGIDAHVFPVQVSSDALEPVLSSARQMGNLAGLGVTIPHKQHAAVLLDHVTDRARQIGAVNIIRRDPDGSLTGENVDGAGFLRGLADSDIDPRDMRVVLLGAGGAGRAIAFAMAAAGVRELTIVNRTQDRAVSLAAAIGRDFPRCKATGVGQPEMSEPDMIINATALGMADGDALPVDPALFDSPLIVVEAIMKPPVTPMLAKAKAYGHRVVQGDQMMRGQIDAAIDFWGLNNV